MINAVEQKMAKQKLPPLSRLLGEIPDWAASWPCDGCGRQVRRSNPMPLLRLGQLQVCGRCFMLHGVETGDVASRIAKPSTSGWELKEYQKEAVGWLARRRVALLNDQAGVGKTAPTLRAVPEGYGLCVICPATLVSNWEDEAQEWRPDLIQLEPNKPEHWSPGGPGYMTARSFEWLRSSIRRIRKPRFKVVLAIDEAQRAKHPGKQTTQALRELRDMVLEADGRVWEVTATPWLNDPDELWSVWQNAFLGFAAFEDGWDDFDDVFEDWFQSPRDERGPPTGAKRQRLYQAIGPVGREPGQGSHPHAIRLRRLKSDVLAELPPKKIEIYQVALKKADADLITGHTKQLVAYRRVWDEVTKGVIKDPNEAGLTADQQAHRLKAFDDHVAYVIQGLAEPTPEEARLAIDEALKWTKKKRPGFAELAKARSALAHAKIAALVELVERYEEHGEPVVVFSAHRKPVEVVASRKGWARIEGKVTMSARRSIVKRFQAGELAGVAITIDSGGVGITLTRAATSIFVDLDWTPAINSQAEDRIHRLGQTRECSIVRMVANHVVDQRVQEILQEKIELIESIDGEV